MSKIIALDYGTVRIGVAVSDDEQKYSFARPAITTSNPTEQQRRVHDLVREENARLIVLGLPLNMSGSATQQTEKVKAFGAAVTVLTGLPVEYWDERLTSQGAQRILGDDRTGKLDSLVAQQLLEDYLTHTKS